MYGLSLRRPVARPDIAVAPAVLVALAGCLGGGSTGPTTSTDQAAALDSTADDANTGSTASAGTGATPTANRGQEPGEGFTADHVDALRERAFGD